jgi:hypothetical protein
MKLLAIVFGMLLGFEAYAVECTGRYTTGSSYVSGTVVREFNLGDVSFFGAESKCKEKAFVKLNADRGNSGTMSSIGSEACNKGIPSGTNIYMNSKAGLTPTGGSDGLLGKVNRTQPTYSCPSGSVLNGTNCVRPLAYTCSSGYWLETQNTQAGAKCVRQAAPAGTMPGMTPWKVLSTGVIGGLSGNYLSDANGGTRFFVNANASCPSGFSQGSGALSIMCIKTATVVTQGSCSLSL